MFKRAQAAMEFLMTYGWAILVVLAAIGALAYFGVLSPGNLLPHKCEFSAGLDCTETPSVSAAGLVQFPLTNSNGYRVHPLTAVPSGDVTGCGAATFLQSGAAVTEVPNGESFIVNIPGCTVPQAGERYSAQVVISYTSNSTGMTHNVNGRIVGKIA